MSFAPGDIVFFDVLHIDTAHRKQTPSGSDDSVEYEVKGKPRRMLVLSGGPEWYLLLKITGQRPGERSQRYFFPHPLQAAGLSKESFLRISETYRYPEKLASGKKGAIDRSVLKDIQARLLQASRYGPPVIEGTTADWPL